MSNTKIFDSKLKIIMTISKISDAKEVVRKNKDSFKNPNMIFKWLHTKSLRLYSQINK